MVVVSLFVSSRASQCLNIVVFGSVIAGAVDGTVQSVCNECVSIFLRCPGWQSGCVTLGHIFELTLLGDLVDTLFSRLQKFCLDL